MQRLVSSHIQRADVIFQDRVLDGGENAVNVFRVRGAGEMREYDLAPIRSQIDERLEDEFPRRACIAARTLEFREIVVEMRVGDFLLEDVLFVEEENDGGVEEPRVGDDQAEKRLAFFHAVHGFRFDENLQN